MSTKIEWTEDVWNPTRGCSRVSEGCRFCYAERQAARNFSSHRSPTTGEAFAILTDSGPRWTGKLELIESKLYEPLHWKKPRRVFVNSMSDLFHENLPDEAIDRVFAVMALTPHITYQVLTKRAGRMHQYFENRNRAGLISDAMNALPGWRAFQCYLPLPLPNVWLGVSVENQPTADERIPELLRTPASLRFVSYEPALAEVDWRKFLRRRMDLSEIPGWALNDGCTDMWTEGIDWGIIGGESGPQARPFHLEWVRSTIRQFEAAGVPLFVKQLGSKPLLEFRNCGDSEFAIFANLKDSKGGDPDEWPKDIRVRQFPKGNL